MVYGVVNQAIHLVFRLVKVLEGDIAGRKVGTGVFTSRFTFQQSLVSFQERLSGKHDTLGR